MSELFQLSIYSTTKKLGRPNKTDGSEDDQIIQNLETNFRNPQPPEQ